MNARRRKRVRGVKRKMVVGTTRVAGVRWLCALACATMLGCGQDPVEPWPSQDSEVSPDAGLSDVAMDAEEAPGDAAFADMSTTDLDQGDLTFSDGSASVDVSMGDVGSQDAIQGCDPALALGPAESVVAQFGYLQLQASGGSGQYRFTLLENASGAVVNLLTGSYLAGGTGSVNDVVLLEDVGCEGKATLSIQVVDDPILTPEEAAIPPNACLQFDVQFGSGDFSYEIVSGTPMGTIDESGLYVAGGVSGSDIVRVLDLQTQQTNDSVIIIDPNSDLNAAPAKLFIPLGSDHRVPVVGGSGHYEVVSSEPSVIADGEILLGAEAGSSVVTVTDKYVSCVGTGEDGFLETQVDVTTVASLELPGTLFNTGGWARIEGPGDLDGDGIPDAVISHDRSNIGGYRSGAVTVFKGTISGLEKTPSWTGSSASRSAYYGRFISVQDVDGDGQKDLLVTAPEDSFAGDRFGAVYLYLGLEDGFFEEAPSRVWTGTEANERFGSSITSCDFDGDGLIDLAVGADLAEDEELSPVQNDQGAVFIFRGTVDGFEATSSQQIYGVTSDPDEGWIAKNALYFGQDVASGDFNGDGVCDLAMSSRAYAHEGQGNAGAVLLFAGGENGLTDAPIRAWAGIEESDAESYFAYCLTMVDVDQDGLSDVVACQREHDFEGQANTGAIRIFRGDGGIGTEPADGFLSAETSDWSVVSDNGGDRLGYSLDVADVTGDGIADIIGGAGFDEAWGHPSGTGTLNVYRGQAGELPETQPMRKIAGEKASDAFGLAVGDIGDLDGDGISELGAVALNTDVEGANVPRFYMAWGRDAAAIPWGSEWKYFDDGFEPPEGWFGSDFDDSLWAEGPGQLGFGDEDEATLINPDAKTVYFRRSVDIAEPDSLYEFVVRYDDGFALWINGVLVHAQNLAEGEEGLTHDATAASQSENSLVKFATAPDEVNPLVEGENVIAVMMKQASKAGGDMSFDLELSLYQGANPDEGTLELLSMPNVMSYDQNGRSVAIITDITNDGYEDVLVGAPGAAPLGKSAEFGQVHIFQGTDLGVSPDVFESMSGFRQTAGGIEVGFVVGEVGDVDGDGQKDFAFHARETAQPKSFDADVYEAPAACEKKKNSVGATYVFQGGPGAGYTSTEPAFIFFGPEVNRDPDKMIGGFDVDGDGYDDIAMGSRSFRGPKNLSSAGGVAIYRGGADTPGKTTIVCEPYAHFVGLKSGVQMGRGLTVLGKLDDDACDEIAVGADLEDLDGKSNQGSVRIIYGWGPKCNSQYPRVVTLVPGATNSRAGWALDGNEDIDGDGMPDLVVGAPDYRQGSLRIGAVYILTGAYLASLEPDVTITGDLPQNPTLYPFTPPNTDPLVVYGTNETTSGTNMSWFGSSVRFVPNLDGGQAGFAVGAYNGNNPGPNRVGDVRVWSYDDGILELVAAVGGETLRPQSRFGQYFDAGLIKGVPTLVIGAWVGTAADSVDAVDDGTVYVVPLK